MSWYPKVAEIRDNGFGGSRNGQPINGVVIHHVAGTNGLSYVANKNDRNSHPTYHIARSGAVTGIVNPDRRPYSTGGTPDPNAVSFEIDNSSTGGDWPVTNESIEALIDVIIYHASQSPRAGKGFALNEPSVRQSEFFIAWHSQYKATACPGPFIKSKLDYIVSECNRRTAPAPAPVPAPAPAPAPKPTPKPTPAPANTSIRTIANQVIAGKWGTGKTRELRLADAGYDPKAVQSLVNKILSEKNKPTPKPVLKPTTQPALKRTPRVGPRKATPPAQPTISSWLKSLFK